MRQPIRTKIASPLVLRSLLSGGVGVLATDTIYGLVGRALSKKTVERIYRLKKRAPQKPFIILISGYEDLKKFGAKPMPQLKKYWPGKVSVILEVPGKKFAYLHRGTGSLAFRMPRLAKLRQFLKKSGPLVAPSANPEGLPPAENMAEAEEYFGNRIDFYLDSGRRRGRPSKLLKIDPDGKVQILRK